MNRVQRVTASGPSSASATFAFPVNVTAGNTIIVVVVTTSFHAPTNCSDSRGNGYVGDGSYGTNSMLVSFFRAFVGSSGACTVTVALNGVGFVSGVVYEVQATLDFQTSGYDDEAGFDPPDDDRAILSSTFNGALDVFAVGGIGAAPMTTSWPNEGANGSPWRDGSFSPYNPNAYRAAVFDAGFVWSANSGQLVLRFGHTINEIRVVAATVYYERLAASFSGSPLSGAAPLTVNFDATASKGYSLGYSWDFGDGQFDVGSTVSHVYAVAGTYTVTLTVSNAAGSNSQTRQLYIVVGPGGPPPVGPAGTGYGYGSAGAGIAPIPGFPLFDLALLSFDPTPQQTPNDQAKFEELAQQAQVAIALMAEAQAEADDVGRVATAIQQLAGTLNALIDQSVLSLDDNGDWSIITSGRGDRDLPEDGQYGDQGNDGDLWVRVPGSYVSVRRGLQPATDDDKEAGEPDSLWVCVLDQNNLPQWFEVELIGHGATTG